LLLLSAVNIPLDWHLSYLLHLQQTLSECP
jgi:hypothetical protein